MPAVKPLQLLTRAALSVALSLLCFLALRLFPTMDLSLQSLASLILLRFALRESLPYASLVALASALLCFVLGMPLTAVTYGLILAPFLLLQLLWAKLSCRFGFQTLSYWLGKVVLALGFAALIQWGIEGLILQPSFVRQYHLDGLIYVGLSLGFLLWEMLLLACERSLSQTLRR